MFIVGGLTSFLIEASVFSKKYLAMVYSEPLSLNSPRRVFREYTHFKEVNNLPNVILIHQRQDLAKSFRETFLSPESTSRDEVDASLIDILEINEKKTYGNRLRHQLESLYEQHFIDAGRL